MNDFAFCKQCGTPLTEDAMMLLEQVREMPEYIEMKKLADGLQEMDLMIPYASEREKLRDEENNKLRERVLTLLAQDRGTPNPIIPESENKRLSKEEYDEKKRQYLDKISALLDKLAQQPQPRPAQVRNYAMACRPQGVRLAWQCNYKHALHSSPCGCAKPQTFDPTRQEDINATRRINVGPSTVRPASSTIRPASATVRPASSTIRSSAMMGGSVRPNSLATPDDNVDDKYFLLKGNKYKNIQSLSEDTGEAQVFLVERDGEKYVLKIYYPNFDVNKKVLQTVYNFDFEMIVKVYDFGKTYVDGKHRYYELMEFLKGGTMQEYRLNGDMDKFRRIALQGAAALAYCHQCGILHKDIKPGNFFFRDKEHTELVLGDFGISSFLDQDGKAHKTTQARTPIYAAPEMYTDVIDGVVEVMPSVDFYSFGICLMTLWLGESPLSSNERTMMRQKSEGRLPRILELPSRVRLIVQGLTVVNAANRWGYKEVEEWFLGGSPKVDLSSPFLKYKSFVVDPDKNLIADNIHELVPLLLDNEKLAIGYLYNGRISQWLESCGNGKLSTIMKDIVANRYPVDQRAGLMSAIYNMEPTFAYKDVKGNLCEDVHSIALSLLSYQGDYAILLTNPNDTLFLYLEAHTTCNIDRLRSYFSKTDKKGSQIAVLKTVYEIDPDIPLLARYPSSTLKEIVESFGREQLTEDDWHSLTDGRLLAWMYSHEDKMVCESMRILTQGKPYSESLAYMVLYNLDREAGTDL